MAAASKLTPAAHQSAVPCEHTGDASFEIERPRVLDSTGGRSAEMLKTVAGHFAYRRELTRLSGDAPNVTLEMLNLLARRIQAILGWKA